MHTHTPEHTSLHFTANVSVSVSLGPLFWSSETAVNSLCCQFEEHFLRCRHEVTVATCVFQIQSLKTLTITIETFGKVLRYL